MGAKIQAVDIFQAPLSSHYPLPLMAEEKKESFTKMFKYFPCLLTNTTKARMQEFLST